VAEGANTRSVDVLIVGAGPVGLFGAYYSGVRKLKTALLDSLEEPGGQITAMYPEKAIFDVAGFPAIRGRELVDQLVAQAAPFDPDYVLGHQAVGLERGDGTFAVTTSEGLRIESRAIVITGGIGTFSPRPLPAGQEFVGRGVVHFVPDPAVYKDLNVVVVGGGDSALDEALVLTEHVARVAIFHRGATFDAQRVLIDRAAANSKIEMVPSTVVEEIVGTDNVSGVRLRDLAAGTTHDRAVAGVFIYVGLEPNTAFLRNVVALDPAGHIETDIMMRTSVPGIFAAGDIRRHSVAQLAAVAGDGATAAIAAWGYLKERA
jgi:ferredoxin/flavodoxin---NADP+ reductase